MSGRADGSSLRLNDCFDQMSSPSVKVYSMVSDMNDESDDKCCQLVFAN